MLAQAAGAQSFSPQTLQSASNRPESPAAGMGLAPSYAMKANAKSVLHATAVTSLHSNLHVASSQRCEHVSENSACTPSPAADGPLALPSLTPSPASSL